jgi:hypothetical protein
MVIAGYFSEFTWIIANQRLFIAGRRRWNEMASWFRPFFYILHPIPKRSPTSRQFPQNGAGEKNARYCLISGFIISQELDILSKLETI